jgi:hypothetical protein
VISLWPSSGNRRAAFPDTVLSFWRDCRMEHFVVSARVSVDQCLIDPSLLAVEEMQAVPRRMPDGPKLSRDRRQE